MSLSQLIWKVSVKWKRFGEIFSRQPNLFHYLFYRQVGMELLLMKSVSNSLKKFHYFTLINFYFICIFTATMNAKRSLCFSNSPLQTFWKIFQAKNFFKTFTLNNVLSLYCWFSCSYLLKNAIKLSREKSYILSTFLRLQITK